MSAQPASLSFPRIIHQIWIQGADRVPPRYRRDAETWRLRNPGWRYRLWDGSAIDRLLERTRPDLLRLFREAEASRARADIGRYAILSAHGGIYADLDTRCSRRVEPLLRSTEATLVLQRYQPTLRLRRSRGLFDCVANSVIASAAGHPVWPGVFAELAGLRSLGRFWWLQTGPEMFRRHAAAYSAQYPRGVEVLKPRRIVTSFLLPRWLMLAYSRCDRRVRVLDFNDDARRAASEILSPRRLFGLVGAGLF